MDLAGAALAAVVERVDGIETGAAAADLHEPRPDLLRGGRDRDAVGDLGLPRLDELGLCCLRGATRRAERASSVALDASLARGCHTRALSVRRRLRGVVPHGRLFGPIS